MEITKRPLNAGEVFSCSFKQAKSIFKDTEILLDFAKYGRDFGTFANTPDRFYVKHNVKGIVIACSYMHLNVPRAMISFFVLKGNNYSEKQREMFEQKYLPEFYTLYKSLNDGTIKENVSHLLMVELIDGEFKLHHFKYR